MLTFRVPTDTVEYLREDRIIDSVGILRYDYDRIFTELCITGGAGMRPEKLNVRFT
jgi:hypothetical protein